MVDSIINREEVLKDLRRFVRSLGFSVTRGFEPSGMAIYHEKDEKTKIYVRFQYVGEEIHIRFYSVLLLTPSKDVNPIKSINWKLGLMDFVRYPSGMFRFDRSDTSYVSEPEFKYEFRRRLGTATDDEMKQAEILTKWLHVITGSSNVPASFTVDGVLYERVVDMTESIKVRVRFVNYASGKVLMSVNIGDPMSGAQMILKRIQLLKREHVVADMRHLTSSTFEQRKRGLVTHEDFFKMLTGVTASIPMPKAMDLINELVKYGYDWVPMRLNTDINKGAYFIVRPGFVTLSIDGVITTGVGDHKWHTIDAIIKIRRTKTLI